MACWRHQMDRHDHLQLPGFAQRLFRESIRAARRTDDVGFSAAPIQMQQAINYAIGLIQSYTNATIQFAGTDGADIMVAQSSAANPTSYAYYPGNVPAGGDVWFGTAYDYS